MNQPPPLPAAGEFHAPAARSHDFFGAAALALGVICAVVTVRAIYLWRDVGQYRASLPPHTTEGAMGFSLQFYPWLFTFCGISVGILAFVGLVASYIQRRAAHQPRLTCLQVGTILSLVPLLYLVLRFAGVFFR